MWLENKSADRLVSLWDLICLEWDVYLFAYE